MKKKKKTQINLTEMKITNEMKNTLYGINDGSDITGENISELEGIATIQSETQRKKKRIQKEKKRRRVASLSYETTARVI